RLRAGIRRPRSQVAAGSESRRDQSKASVPKRVLAPNPTAHSPAKGREDPRIPALARCYFSFRRARFHVTVVAATGTRSGHPLKVREKQGGRPWRPHHFLFKGRLASAPSMFFSL